MGVPGLWDILRPACKQRSLTHLAVVDGFEGNPAGRRGLRVGIDASIWFYHAAYGKEGENPELRTMFFRCARLMNKPFLPLFVFDGPKRPSTKRKKKVSGKDHWLTSGMQKIIEAFGFEWRMAPGEAEAELAYLNRIGVIDAIISDDVDTFVFGAVMIIRNPSKTLSGNTAHPVKNSAGKEDDEHVNTFNSKDFEKHPDIALTKGGLILIALLRGGDYNPEGLSNFGVNVAHGLARCGFGDKLLEATQTLARSDLETFLVDWRSEVRQELRTNSRGYLGTKKIKLAQSIPESFPDVDTLLLYTNPVTSESERRSEKVTYDWNREPDLGKLGGICEWFFEWGVREIIIKRFRTVMWGPMVLRILRRSALREDEKAVSLRSSRVNVQTPKKAKSKVMPKSPGTPSTMIARHFSSMRITHSESSDEDDKEENDRLIVKIHSKREHASTDGVLEYRLEINPTQLVSLTEAGIEGKRQLPEKVFLEDVAESDDEDDEVSRSRKKGPKKPPPDPCSNLRVWMPACMVKLVEPDLVREFEEEQESKQLKKASAAGRKALKAQGLPVPRTRAKATSSSKTKVDAPERNLGKTNKFGRFAFGISETDEEDVFASPIKLPGTSPSNSRSVVHQKYSCPALQVVNSPQDELRLAHKGLFSDPFLTSQSDSDSDVDDGSAPPLDLQEPFRKTSNEPTSILKLSKRITSTESSENENRSPKKSPRKSFKHKSIQGDDELDLSKNYQNGSKRPLTSSSKPLLAVQQVSVASKFSKQEYEESDFDSSQRSASPSPLQNTRKKKVYTNKISKTTTISEQPRNSRCSKSPVEIIEISSDSDDSRVVLELTRCKNSKHNKVKSSLPHKRAPSLQGREVIELSD